MRFGGQGPRRRALLNGVVVLAIVAVLGGAFLWYQSEKQNTPPPQDRPGPVVLVPGYGGAAGSLEVLASRIRQTGRHASVLTPAEGGVGDLNRQATALEDHVSEVLSAGAPSVDVIGYSAGGVVARLWVQNHDGASKARRVITLGSPHHGAAIAAAGAAAAPGACPAACRQLAPGSSLIAGLLTPVPTPPVWLSLWTSDDETVTPPDSARLEGAVNVAIQTLCPTKRLSHSELTTDAVVAGLVLAALGPQPLTAPTPGRCLSS
jgi:triacylglycerol esterase/lipase EstA (alpha/beta hydrolase family)